MVRGVAALVYSGGMAGEWVLWFDARSDDCRRALQLLRERGVEPSLRRFLEEPPSPEEIDNLLARLRVPAHAVVRSDADEYHALRLSERTPDPDLVLAISRHPRILERPIVVAGGRAVVARPPERALDLIARAAAGAG